MDVGICKNNENFGHNFTKIVKTWELPNMASGRYDNLKCSREVLVCIRCGIIVDPFKEEDS